MFREDSLGDTPCMRAVVTCHEDVCVVCSGRTVVGDTPCMRAVVTCHGGVCVVCPGRTVVGDTSSSSS